MQANNDRARAAQAPDTSWRSPNFGERALPIDMVVLHYTGMQSEAAALERLCDPAYGVSAHYLINESGKLFSLVEEARRAHHAGVSSWDGTTDTNSRSIGIELVNPGHEFGYRDFPKAQIDTLLALLPGIRTRWSIHPGNIWGHSDVAPLRKEDPGEKFPWARLAMHGYGLWPRFGLPLAPQKDPQVLLHLLGYGVGLSDAYQASVVAYKRHFCPDFMQSPHMRAVLCGSDIQRLRQLVALKRRVLGWRRA